MQEKQGTHSARGMLRAGTVEIEYTCAGSGMTVLLLARDPQAGLCAALAACFRLIIPRLPPATTPTSLDAWLDALVDGLGLVRACAVVVGEHAGDLAAIALSDPDRFYGVGVLRADAGATEIAALLADLDARRAASARRA